MELQFDKNNVLDFTNENIDLIKFCVSIDSSYRNAFNPNFMNSSANLITKQWTFEESKIKQICIQIDRENSTHLAVTRGNGNGIDLVVNKILSIEKFEDRLNKGDELLVNEIASAIPSVSKFSFASKFCTYVARYKNKRTDLYSIYDNVISDILPYFVWKFLGTKKYVRIKRNKEYASTIKDCFAKREHFDYAGYNKLISKIINAINKQNKVKIDKLIFDRVLWYYYKGDKQLRQDVLNKIPQ